ncbi:hypothetical protein GCM10011374_01540 [Kocuria dechangensis]|uniref:Uncharacterized protein n=1 Tax=Kocuria dechangensis TaxID=1176249 RepID=A0A917GEW6_9MICC|nr:hypothetical protein [Kocuria dechangensis]GGG42846.1 hypothetical protein GCM10011374_01540 [Kocuria dechangensis]
MSATPPSSDPSRRTVLGAGAAAAVSVLLRAQHAAAEEPTPAPTVPEQPAPEPTAPEQPTPSPRRDLVLWGSSSAASHAYDRYPVGFRPVRIHEALAVLLGVAGSTEGVAGHQSHHTVAMRRYDRPYRPDFAYLGQGGVLPSQGKVVLSVLDGRMPTAYRRLPGTVAGVPCSIEAVPGRRNKVLLRREGIGEEVVVGSGPQSWWHTGLEAAHRGKTHLIWTGKNNIMDVSGVLADTRAVFEVEPATSVVMGHFPSSWYWENPSGALARLRQVNDAYRAEYGRRYFDALAALRDPALWKVGDLARFSIGTSPADKLALGRGMVPPSLMAPRDGLHLNALGNLVIAHGLARFLTGAAGLY